MFCLSCDGYAEAPPPRFLSPHYYSAEECARNFEERRVSFAKLLSGLALPTLRSDLMRWDVPLSASARCCGRAVLRRIQLLGTSVHRGAGGPLRDPRHVEESSLLLDPEDLLPARDRMLLFSSPH